MSIGGSSGSSQTQLDPDIKADWESLLGTATGVAGQPTPQQQVAGFTADQNLGQSYGAGNAGAGISAANDAVNKLENLSGSTYSPNVQVHSANYVGDVATPGAVANIGAPQQGDLSPYLNPYQQNVIDTTMQQADQARQQALVGNQSGITTQGGEGAWNGARAGVQNAQTNALALNQEAAQLANLNAGNFTNAQQAAQTWGQLDLTANQANQGAQIANNQLAAAIAQGNQNLAQGVNLTNAGAQNAGELAQAGYLNDTADRQLAAAEAQIGAAPTQQGLYQGAANTLQTIGAAQQAQQQNLLNAQYQNQMNQRNLPLQTLESAFGILPTTNSGSVTNSSGKSAGIGG